VNEHIEAVVLERATSASTAGHPRVRLLLRPRGAQPLRAARRKPDHSGAVAVTERQATDRPLRPPVLRHLAPIRVGLAAGAGSPARAARSV